MPIFECKVAGADKPRLVKASSGAAARAHIVTAKAITAERMAELIAEDVKLETATDPTDPASHAPGGALHGKAGGGE